MKPLQFAALFLSFILFSCGTNSQYKDVPGDKPEDPTQPERVMRADSANKEMAGRDSISDTMYHDIPPATAADTSQFKK